ncbi:enoyl-CoA hydratase/isomerase family protein [Alkalicoccus saliphilus]|uniref:Enoyl-CoA hydratase n=1 Tax=Alkalicoccus saliphilus TaxID=200989 RepID=A0A2T4U2Y4_9BACI|nr:enoyl-CoA hydratase-related protein [Alkalicoccus saliphilus]PTL37756.1 enoyl-CoA hydratase [Alkalicoccus saliphilus]
MSKNIITTVENRAAWITINRPEQRNAINKDVLNEIDEALVKFEQDENVRVIIFTGAGEKSFAAGADIKQLSERKMLEALIPGMQKTYKNIENCSKATIAAINGFALGGGFELALACDIRIAAKEAKLGLPELNLAIVPGAGGTQRLSRIAGKGKALEMILLGKIIDGEEAERCDIVSASVPKEELIDEAYKMAETIASKGPVAVHLAKIAVHRGSDVDLETAQVIEKFAQTIAFGTEDKQEGTTAFLEKRKPDFQNK